MALSVVLLLIAFKKKPSVIKMLFFAIHQQSKDTKK
jgi:hypothetical protein